MKSVKNNIQFLVWFILVVGIFPFSSVFGQSVDVCRLLNPKAYVIVENGVRLETEMDFEDGTPYNAQLIVRFEAGVELPENMIARYEWKSAYDDEFQNSYLFPRDGKETEIPFNESGTYYVGLFVTFEDEEENKTDCVGSVFTVVISESDLKVPNAFSPNGDGINDIFKVTHKSLIRFNAYVFNRWGQELYRWGIANIDDGWDGTYKGKPVKDGVYFIVIEAEGSDGVKYKHKGDINILRGFSGTGNIPVTE